MAQTVANRQTVHPYHRLASVHLWATLVVFGYSCYLLLFRYATGDFDFLGDLNDIQGLDFNAAALFRVIVGAFSSLVAVHLLRVYVSLVLMESRSGFKTASVR